MSINEFARFKAVMGGSLALVAAGAIAIDHSYRAGLVSVAGIGLAALGCGLFMLAVLVWRFGMKGS